MPAVEVINMSNGDDVAVARRERRLVRVTRPSIWSNPFSEKAGAARFTVRTRDEALDKYEQYLKDNPKLIEQAKRELRGKILGCWCLPQRCHAQVLARLVNEAFPGDAKVPQPKPPPTVQEQMAEARKHSPKTLVGPLPDAVIATAVMGGYDPRAYGARCDECPLKGRHTPVPPAYAQGGPSATKLIIIGEGPGRMEIAEGRPFIGPSGQMVNKMLSDAGARRGDCHVTNAACCLDGRSMVRLADGSLGRIDQLVKHKYRGKVMTLDAKGNLTARRVTGWHRNPIAGRRLLEVTFDYARRNVNGVSHVVVTEEHRIKTRDGWCRADQVNGITIATGDRAPWGSSYDIAVGTLLGDGSISYGRSYLAITHAEDQREYAELKAKALAATVAYAPAVGEAQPQVRVRTQSSGFYRQLRDTFYDGRRKHIPQSVLDKLSDLAVAIWFMDDGYMRINDKKGHRAAELCVACFTQQDVARTVKRLNGMGFECRATHPSKKVRRIHFTAGGSRELSRRIAEYVPPSMQYKLLPEDRGNFAYAIYNPLIGPFWSRAIVRPYSNPTTSTVVYCLDVEDTHCFSTPGAIVHNCRGDTDWEKERAAACCSARLSNELTALDPRIPILALGAPAARVMLGKGSILKTRGLVWTLPEVDPTKIRAAERALEKRKALDQTKFAAAVDRSEQSLWRAQARAPLAGRTCIPSIHPAFVLRGGEHLAPMLRVDVRRAVRASIAPLALLDKGPFTVARTAEELHEQLKSLRSEQLIIDVETLGPEPLHDKMTMFGLSEVPDGTVVREDDVRVVLASPPRDTRLQRRKLQKELKAMGKVVNEFIQTRIVGGHNFATFDMLVLPRYGMKPKRIFCTLIAHHTYASHLRQGLDHLASMYTDVGPWKVEFKSKGAEEKGGVQSRWMSSEDLDIYNAADVRVNGVAWHRQQPDLESELHVYEKDLLSASICRDMATVGFYFDQALADELSAKLKARAGALLGQMRTILGKPGFHPARPNDLRAALFGQLRVTPLAITATGLASTASGTLEKVKSPDTQAGRLAGLILRWRATQKTRSTFIERITPGPDKRVHPAWKSFGTVTGRFSCSRPNLMNLPRWSRALEDRVRELYTAAPGYVLIYFDLSQSEMRMAAYISGDEAFIASCESGDVHTANAKILFPDALDVLEKDPKGKYCERHGDTGSAKAECTCGKPFRDVAKNAGFGILYQADSETIFKFLLSKGFDVTLQDVVAMFDEVHKRYARYYEFCAENWHYCKRHGHLREFFSDRIRWFGWYPSITDTSNYPVQGGIAALMNERLQRLHPQLPRGARFVAQIHDACIIEAKGSLVSTSILGKDGKPMQKDVLHGTVATKTVDLIKRVWDDEIITPTNGKKWKMPIDLKVGRRWSDFG